MLEQQRDPYLLYRELQAVKSVHWDDPTNSWYVLRYADVRASLRDTRFSARPGNFVGSDLRPSELRIVQRVERFFDRWMVFSDPPAQQRMRAAVSPALGRAAVQAWQVTGEALARDLLLRNPQDLFSEFAEGLASAMTLAVLGVHDHEAEMVRSWSRDILSYLGTPMADPRRAEVALVAIEHMESFVTGPLCRRVSWSSEPELQVLRGLFALGREEATATFAQILTGGIGPVASSIASGIQALAADARVIDAMVEGKVSSSDVVDEALRFDAPFHFIPRTALESVDVGGAVLHKGDRVVLLVAAANRDPESYDSPDEFDAFRSGPAHLAFGLGTHYCLGALLARQVLRAALEAFGEWYLSRGERSLRFERGLSFGSTAWERVGVGM